MSLAASLSLSHWSAIQWHHPWGWLAAAVPAVLWLVGRLRRRGELRYAETALRPWALRRAGDTALPSRRAGGALVHALAWLLLGAALAGPRLPQLHAGPKGQGDVSRADVTLMVVLQVPFEPQGPVAQAYLQRVWSEVQDLQARLHGERLGLVAYNGRAGLLSTPTADAAAFRFYLRRAGAAMAGWRGDALGRALLRARAALGQARAGGHSTGIVLVAAGGATPDPDVLARALEALHRSKIPVFALDMHAFAAGLLGRHPHSQAFGLPHLGPGAPRERGLGAVALHEVARRTGGVYARLSEGGGDWDRLYGGGAGALPSRPGSAGEGGKLVHSWRPLYMWFLAPALLLLLLDAVGVEALWRPRGRPPIALVLALLVVAGAGAWAPPAAAGPAQRGTPAYAAAYRAYHAQDYALAQLRFAAIPGYAGRLGGGASAYRRGDYGQAARQFTAALLAATSARQRTEALFDLGNARFRHRQYAKAVEAYQGALGYARQAGGFDEAAIRHNLWRARSRLTGTQRRGRALGPGEGLPARRGEPPPGFPDETPPDVSVKGARPHGKVARRIARGELSARADRERGESGSSPAPGPGAEDPGLLKLLDLIDDHTAALLRGVITHAPAPGPPAGSP